MTALPLEITTGTLVPAGAHDASPLPLESMEVAAHVTGPLASVTVTQVFGNPFGEPVELSYLFPLPHEAAVFDFELRTGDRVVTATVEEFEAARRSYEEARSRGRLASLLEQKKLSLFSLDLANVRPGESVRATLRYQERLRYDDGHYKFVFPMGVTPRYARTAEEVVGADSSVSAPGSPASPVELTVSVDAGAEITDVGSVESPSHPIEVSRLDERRVQVRLSGNNVPNKDFVLRYKVAGEEVGARAWLSASPAGARLLATLVPPTLLDAAEPPPREFVFVLDRSGSMSGGPLAEAKNALRACLRTLGGRDSFALLAFDDRLEWFTKAAVAYSQKAVTEADHWLDRLDARGGTEIAGALGTALSLPADEGRRRYVVFLTDGAVHDESGVLEMIRRSVGSARLFSFGLGPSVNRGLLAKAAEAGRGTAEFLQLGEDVEGAIIRFQDRVSFPVLTDLRLEWEGVKAWDIYPRALQDLYAGQPLEVVACTAHEDGRGEGALTLVGTRGGEELRVRVELPRPAGRERAVERAWARARVDDMLSQSDENPRTRALFREQVIGLAVEHRLVTPYTSLVAVDDEGEACGDGRPRRVAVSQQLPEGLDHAGFRTQDVPMACFSMPNVAPPPPQSMPAAAKSRGRGFGRATGNRLKDLFGLANRNAEPSPSFEEEMAATPPASTALSSEGLLRDLARTQNVSGSWGAGSEELELTAAAVLAFVRGGHNRRTGHFRRQMSKAVTWLLTQPSHDGFASRARRLALQEVAEAEGDIGLRRPAAPGDDSVETLVGQARERVAELRRVNHSPLLLRVWEEALGRPV